MNEKIKDVLGIVDLSIDPMEVAAFMPEQRFKEWRMVFLMKSGETIKTGLMNEVCFRSWREKLQKLFHYIHPGKIDEWILKTGFTKYLP